MTPRWFRSSIRGFGAFVTIELLHVFPVEDSEESDTTLDNEKNDFESLVFFFVEQLAVDTDQDAEEREQLDAEVDVVGCGFTLEDVVDKPVG